MTVPFADHFSDQSEAYRRHRPDYPPGLFAWLASRVPAAGVAWDVGTGNGQAATGLAGHVRCVVGTDPSAAQLAHARPHPGVRYVAGAAEAAPLADGTVDLVTAAQAAHWFDPARFHPEVRRVLVPAGFVAVWCYDLFRVDDAVDRIVRWYHDEVVGAFWPPERRHVVTHYAELSFPFHEEAPPQAFGMRRSWVRGDLVAQLDTWSATRRARSAGLADPLRVLEGELTKVWPDPDARRNVEWSLHLRSGRP